MPLLRPAPQCPTNIPLEAAGYQAQGAVYQQQGAEAEVVAMHLAATGATLQGRQDILEEQNYNLAAKFATENVDITEASTKMQEAAEQRQAFSTIGTQKAGEAGGGLAESGSALDILRSSNEQAAYGKAVLAFQGGVTEAGFSEQAASNYMMAQAAKKAYEATGITSQEDQQAAIMQQDTAEMYGTEQQEYLAQEQAIRQPSTASTASSIVSGVGGALGLVASMATLFSDIRLKRDIALVSRLPSGIALYRYRYIWSDEIYVGVIAQEVAKIMPSAAIMRPDGYLMVDYDKLGIRMLTWREWLDQNRAAA